MLTIENRRVRPIAESLAAIPDTIYENIDKGEPEWAILQKISSFPAPMNVLMTIAVALSDFQLGSGGAAQYWREINQLLDGPINSPSELRAFMQRLLTRPVAARLRTMKLARVDRLLNSDVPQWLAARTVENVGRDCMDLWMRLSAAMRQPSDRKTIVFAMKTVDLLHRIVVGTYIQFPGRVPIVADLRIGRVSLSSGLLFQDGESVQRAMSGIGELLTSSTDTVLSAWASVSDAAQHVSLFRIDSLVWQVAEPIYQQRETNVWPVFRPQRFFGATVRMTRSPR